MNQLNLLADKKYKNQEHLIAQEYFTFTYFNDSLIGFDTVNSTLRWTLHLLPSGASNSVISSFVIPVTFFLSSCQVYWDISSGVLFVKNVCFHLFFDTFSTLFSRVSFPCFGRFGNWFGVVWFYVGIFPSSWLPYSSNLGTSFFNWSYAAPLALPFSFLVLG